MGFENNNSDLKKAKEYALRLFKLRPRSAQELRQKLALKGYPQDVTEIVIEEFIQLGFLDDAAFARAWMQSRLKKYGLRRVEQELRDKGILREKIAALREELHDEYDEEAVVRQMAVKKIGARSSQGVPILKRKQRVMGYLLRRGFAPGVVGKVIRELKG